MKKKLYTFPCKLMRLLNHKMNVRVYSVQFSSIQAPPTPSPRLGGISYTTHSLMMMMMMYIRR